MWYNKIKGDNIVNMKKPNLAFIVDSSKVEEFFRINKESPKSIDRAIKRMEAKLKALKKRKGDDFMNMKKPILAFTVAPDKTDAFWKLIKEGPSAEQAVKEVKEKIRKRMEKGDK